MRYFDIVYSPSDCSVCAPFVGNQIETDWNAVSEYGYSCNEVQRIIIGLTVLAMVFVCIITTTCFSHICYSDNIFVISCR